MKITQILDLAEKHGDFYMYYRKLHAPGTTYLGGTLDFDNKYIQAKHASGTAGVRSNISLAQAQQEAMAEGSVIVFSWTNDKFRIINMEDVRRMTPLFAGISNGNHR